MRSRMHRNRILSLGLVLGFLAALHAAEDDPARRERWLYLVALPLGYGHLIGALVFARKRLRRRVGDQHVGLVCALAVSLTATLLAAYTWLLHAGAWGVLVVLLLLVLSAWHIAENDLELGRAYRHGLTLGSVRPSGRERWLIAAAVLLLMVAALATPSGGTLAETQLAFRPLPPWTSIADLATLVLLYHAASWCVFFLDRARAAPQREARSLRRRLVWVHALPFALNLSAYLWFQPVFAYLSMPTLYLFWSSLHALHTGLTRSLGTPPCPRSAG